MRAALPASFYDRPVLEVAADLIGCSVSYGGCSGVIVETEAYHDSEPACHAFVGLTPRTATLFGPPGIAYVYRSYGIHALLNAVCEGEGVGAAVLIRALEPVTGLELMELRRGSSLRSRSGSSLGSRSGSSLGSRSGSGSGRPPGWLRDLCSGPGKLTQALGIGLALNGTSLVEGPIVVSARSAGRDAPGVSVGRRIGITKAVELPWRFCATGSRFLSAPVRP